MPDVIKCFGYTVSKTHRHIFLFNLFINLNNSIIIYRVIFVSIDNVIFQRKFIILQKVPCRNCGIFKGLFVGMTLKLTLTMTFMGPYIFDLGNKKNGKFQMTLKAVIKAFQNQILNDHEINENDLEISGLISNP